MSTSYLTREQETGIKAGKEEPRQEMAVGLLTGGGDRHYAFGLAMALVGQGVAVDFIGGDEVDCPELHGVPKLTFLNLRRNGSRNASMVEKVLRVLQYYARLIRYAATAQPKVFHILWNNKFEAFDRTVLMLYYKALGKRMVLTAHNVNAGTRDATDSWWNRFTLRMQYRLTDNIFVHTEKMKVELVESFGVRPDAVTVIRYGINNAVPTTEMGWEEAKRRIGVTADEKTILFFGNMAPYKGLEYLIEAFEKVTAKDGSYRLVIAGREKKGCEEYVNRIRESLQSAGIRERVIARIEFVPDGEMEPYFLGADVSVLPYTHIFQSGVLFLGYSFGLPVIVSDVGSLKEDVLEGETGYVCQPRDSEGLAAAIERYFASDLYRDLQQRRRKIKEYALEQHSWGSVGESTRGVYTGLVRQ